MAVDPTPVAVMVPPPGLQGDQVVDVVGRRVPVPLSGGGIKLGQVPCRRAGLRRADSGSNRFGCRIVVIADFRIVAEASEPSAVGAERHTGDPIGMKAED